MSLRILVLLTLLVPSAAFAQQDDRARARELFREGEAHLAAKRYDEAAVAYEAAYALAPLPAMLYNLGQAHRLAGHVDEAIAAYEKYLVVEPNGKASKEARAHLEALRVEQAERPRQPPLDPHPVPPEERHPPGLGIVDPPDERRPPPGRPGRALRIAGMVITGTGLVVFGAGMFSGLKAREISDELSMPGDGLWTPADEARIADGEMWNDAAIVGYVAGSTLIVGGMVCVLLGVTAEDRAVNVTPTANGISVTGRF